MPRPHHPSPADDTSASIDRLDSWKAIAAHLGRTVRTIQRWEQSAGLPIRRLQHADGASVYALLPELDRWWSERSKSAELESDDAPPIDSAEGASGVNGLKASPASSLPSVGREMERNVLERAFDQTAGGRGVLLTVAGDAGIGKSTLVSDFLASPRTGGKPVLAGRGRSSESLAGTEAFLPLIDALADLLRADASGALRRAMKTAAPLWYAQLDPAKTGVRDSGLDAGASSQPQRIKRELLAFFQEASRVRPIVLFLDDIHWADSSTLDVLAYLTRHIESLRLLAIVAFRPDELLSRKHAFIPLKDDLEARGLCRSLDLVLLGRRDLAEYVERRFPGLPGTFADSVFERTEGNPLFMVSLLGYLNENGAFAEHDARWSLTAAAADLLRDLPESVRGMIRRKIDVLPDAERRVLGAASVQGIEFNAAIVARVLKVDVADVEEHLQRLEHVYRCVQRVADQELPDGTFTVRYRFVHVLYQERLRAAFAPARLAELSRAVAEALTTAYARHSSEIGSRVANLYDTARDFEAASRWYLEAARHAVKVFAYEGAIELGYRGLAAAGRLPIEDRRSRELSLLMLLASAVKAIRGFASNQLPELYTRARDLCVELNQTADLADVLWGLWGSQVIRLDLLGAQDSVRQMQRLCGDAPGSLICVQAAVGDSLVAYYRGDFTHAKASWQLALSLYDADRHGPVPVAAGWDPLVSVHGHAGWAALALGEGDQAVRELDASLARAREQGHVPILLYALFFAAIVHEWRGERACTESLVAEMHRLASDYQLVHFLTISQFLQGRLLAQNGDAVTGLDRMREGLASYEALGAQTLRSRFVAMLAEELGRSGRFDDGLALVDRELNTLGSARYYESELLRIRGVLLRERNAPGDRLDAEESVRRALSVARAQRALAFESRIHGTVDPSEPQA